MKTRYIFCLTAALMLVGMSSCERDDSGRDDSANKGPVDVRVVVSNAGATRSVGSEATDDDIQQLRIYAFNQASGKLAGYALADNLSDQAYVPMTLSELGDTYFYVIANDHFGPNPTVGGTSVTDWSALTQDDLKSLVFDLSGFTGWTVNNGVSISPMSNNRYKEDGTEFGADKYQNDFATKVNVTGNNQVIPVTVQHVLGRLRLLLNKTVPVNVDDIYIVKLTRAVVYHRPDAFRLYNSGSDAITYVNNSESLSDEFLSSAESVELEVMTGTEYTEVARTFLAPNIYGSDDTVGSAPTQHADKAYRLELTVSFAYQGGAAIEKTYTVYLPRVSRNASIDVQGTFDAATVNLKFNVMTNAWVEKNIDIPPFM